MLQMQSWTMPEPPPGLLAVQLSPKQTKGVKRSSEVAAADGDGGGGVGRHATNKISDDGKMPTSTRAAASGGTAPSSAKKAKAAATSTSHVGKKLEFRCNWKHALLTYGGFAVDEITKEELRDFVLGKGDAQRWRIGQETYTQPADPQRPIHYHVAIRYKGKPNTKKTVVVTADDEFDESGAPVYRGSTSCPYDFTTKAGRVVHPNIKTHDSKKRSKKASVE